VALRGHVESGIASEKQNPTIYTETRSSGPLVPERWPLRDEPCTHPFDSAYKNGDEFAVSNSVRVGHQTETPTQISYHEFMALDQGGAANMGCDNTRECNLVAIKTLRGIDKNSIRGIRPFTGDHVVSIRDVYFDNNDLMIIYEQMDVSLRDVASILQGPFEPFQIAAICKEVGISFNIVRLALFT
jgi:hypothetical protein